jgi:lysine 2,3-aminomutase
MASRIKTTPTLSDERLIDDSGAGRTSLVPRFTRERFEGEAARFLDGVREVASLADARARLFAHVTEEQFDRFRGDSETEDPALPVARDCARALRGMLKERSDDRAGFSLTRALWDVARGVERSDLGPGFWAELIHLVRGLEGRYRPVPPSPQRTEVSLKGRAAARRRSKELDVLWARVERATSCFEDGLGADVLERRAARRQQILDALGASESDFDDWRWQVAHVADTEASLASLVPLGTEEVRAIAAARRARLPFGVTPYYASLMGADPASGRDRAIRAQVIPPADYVEHMLASRGRGECALDFMLERDTSPVPLVTRRYPAIAILKPYNTCPQICVYCQRNWEIDQVMAPGALASKEDLERAVRFISEHKAIREVLVTGGDPLAMPDGDLLEILGRLAEVSHVELIRIGTRTPVTMPMRITRELADALGRLRAPGRRELCVVTHVEHVSEVTPELVAAVDRLRRQGIGVYNQVVFSFYVSRRFECAALRMLLRRCGIDPYYTFMTKGKEETASYRVPLARLLQEQKEEARLLPGTRRTDEAVYNVPGLGKSYVRASQHRDLLAVAPDGSRIYDFHPWEKGITAREHYVGRDVPILDYLVRLEEIGEDPEEYESIWYYY